MWGDRAGPVGLDAAHQLVGAGWSVARWQVRCWPSGVSPHGIGSLYQAIQPAAADIAPGRPAATRRFQESHDVFVVRGHNRGAVIARSWDTRGRAAAYLGLAGHARDGTPGGRHRWADSGIHGVPPVRVQNARARGGRPAGEPAAPAGPRRLSVLTADWTPRPWRVGSRARGRTHYNWVATSAAISSTWPRSARSISWR